MTPTGVSFLSGSISWLFRNSTKFAQERGVLQIHLISIVHAAVIAQSAPTVRKSSQKGSVQWDISALLLRTAPYKHGCHTSMSVQANMKAGCMFKKHIVF